MAVTKVDISMLEDISAGTKVVAVAPSTSGNVLTSDGTNWASSTPAAGGAWTFITSVTASNSSTVDFLTSFSTTYDTYLCTFNNIVGEDGREFRVLVAIGGSPRSTSADYRYGYHGWGDHNAADTNGTTSSTYIRMNGGFGTSTGEATNGNIWFHSPTNTTRYKHLTWNLSEFNNSAALRNRDGAGLFQGATTALTGFQFYSSVGNIASGTFYLYGLNKS